MPDEHDLPPLAEPTQEMRTAIAEFYVENSDVYSKVWDRLRDVRAQMARYDRGEKVSMLKLSYLNSVISVNTNVSRHEDAFTQVMAGEPPRDAMQDAGVLYHNNKTRFFQQTLIKDEMWDNVVDLLGDGNVDDADSLLRTQAGFLGAAKSPFTLANLGYTQKMCLDGNLKRLFDIAVDSRMGVDPYEHLCTSVQVLFPGLSDDLEPYQLQWLIFDVQRIIGQGADGETVRELIDMGTADREVAKHDVWFDAALGDINRIQTRMADLTLKARKEYGENGGPLGEAEREIEQAVEDAIEARVDEEMADAIMADVEEAVNGD